MTPEDPLIEGYLALSPRSYSLVWEIQLRLERPEDAPPRALLRIVLIPKEQSGHGLTLQFEGVQRLRLAQPDWSEFSIAYLSITSMTDRGMEGIGYQVRDEEEDSMEFLCHTFRYSIEPVEM
jgi:hypothetical protein